MGAGQPELVRATSPGQGLGAVRSLPSQPRCDSMLPPSGLHVPLVEEGVHDSGPDGVELEVGDGVEVLFAAQNKAERAGGEGTLWAEILARPSNATRRKGFCPIVSFCPGSEWQRAALCISA